MCGNRLELLVFSILEFKKKKLKLQKLNVFIKTPPRPQGK